LSLSQSGARYIRIATGGRFFIGDKMTYSEKLRDPRWQKKRLEILDRDEFTCQRCFDKETTLNVHHMMYFKDKEPWDYPEWCLVTLCESCHEEEKECGTESEKTLIQALKEKRFFSSEISNLAISIHEGDILYPPDVIENFFDLFFHNKDFQKTCTDIYFELIKNKREKKNALRQAGL
jgi:hypothetical protein